MSPLPVLAYRSRYASCWSPPHMRAVYDDAGRVRSSGFEVRGESFLELRTPNPEPLPSNLEHRRVVVPLPLLDERIEGNAAKRLVDRCVHLLPRLAHDAIGRGIATAGRAILPRPFRHRGAVERADDIGDADGAEGPGEVMAALWAAHRADQ